MNRQRALYTKCREQIVKEMLEEVPLTNIFLAALQMMLGNGLIQEGPRPDNIKNKVADWIGTLDANRLLRLREIAEMFEEPKTVH